MARPDRRAECFGTGLPARRASASLTARCAARIAVLAVDSGPSESVLAKKTRSMGCRTKGWTGCKGGEWTCRPDARGGRCEPRSGPDSIPEKASGSRAAHFRRFCECWVRSSRYPRSSSCHGGVEGEDVEFLLVAGMFRSHPVGHNEVGKAISRAPGVVTQLDDGFVENKVHHRIRDVADLMHRLALFVGYALDDAAGDELRGRHDDGFGGDRFEFGSPRGR